MKGELRVLRQKHTSPQAIHKAVVLLLQKTASESQVPVVAELARMQGEGAVKSFQPYFVANCIVVEATGAAFADLKTAPGVAEIEPDYGIAMISDPPAEPDHAFATTQAGLIAIRAPQVWAMGITGAGVLVSHMDTGVNGAHPALTGKWRGSYGYPAAACWFDQQGSTTSPVDQAGHGTQTMGILCGTAPGDTIGVAWGARYISSRLNQQSGQSTVTSALAGFQWLLDPDGDPETFDDVPRVVSNSWGLEAASYPACYSVFDAVIDNCEAAGIAVFFSAGNEGDHGAGTIRIPAARAATPTSSFAVGAYDVAVDSIWSYSSRGPSPCAANPELAIKPELVAPGRSVRSAYLGTSYLTATGTSFSTPHVAGTAALMLEANPALSTDSLKEILLLTAVDKGPPGNDNTYGYGELDALSAVMGALGGVGWVAGHVTDAYGGAIAGVVTIAGDPHHTQADGAGNFALAMPAQMAFTLRVDAATFQSYSRAVTLNAGDTLSLEIVLSVAADCGVITGTVTNCRGIPGAGARVWAAGASVPATETNLDGHFHLVLPQGVYGVSASDGWCADGTVPGVQVSGGGISDIEIVLPANPAYVCSDPDPRGYRACDNNDPGGPVYDWTEIAPAQGGRGTVHNLSEGSTVPLALPFSVSFYGVSRDKLYLNPKGNVSFVRGFTDRVNTALPRNYTPLILPFWDDVSDADGGDVCSYHDAAHGRFIVEWSAVPHYGGGNPESFELVIYDPAMLPTSTGDAVLEMRYRDLSISDDCTVGIDGNGGGNYLQYVYNGSYGAHSSELTGGRAIRFQSGTPSGGAGSLAILNPSLMLSVPQGQTVDTALILSNAGNAPLAYAVTLGYDTASRAYSWTSSRTTGGPAYEFFDITSLGQPTGVAGDDSTGDPRPMPWFFPFYGRSFNRVAICSNGWISFTSCLSSMSWQPVPLNDEHDPYYAIAPYWTDLDPTRGGAILCYDDAERERYILQWNQIRRYGSSAPNTFQIVLYRNGTVDFVYATMASPVNAGAVGIKGRNGEWLQLAYNQAFVQSNTLVRMFQPDTFATHCSVRDAVQGVIAAAQQVRVPLRLENHHMSFGEQSWQVNIGSSDPHGTRVAATVSMLNMPDPSGLHVVLIPAGPGGVTLRWNRIVAPRYCIYSGSPQTGVTDHFETAVTDTFVTLPYAPDNRRVFDVRFCDTSAAALKRQAEVAITRTQTSGK
ncbi:MAG TPA: S8 family serine peptidase [bacterium]